MSGSFEMSVVGLRNCLVRDGQGVAAMGEERCSIGRMCSICRPYLSKGGSVDPIGSSLTSSLHPAPDDELVICRVRIARLGGHVHGGS